MVIEGRIEIGPYAPGSKSARKHQVFLVTSDGERLILRRYDGPPMRDEVLEELSGHDVVADGTQRGGLFIATALRAADRPTAPSRETPLSAPPGKAPRKR